MERTIEQCIANIQEFANKNKVVFDSEGECGFGRECVGLRSGDNWLSYNPLNMETYDPIEKYYDDRHYELSPENAYHKGDYLCVLGRGDGAIRELSEWVDELKHLDASVVPFETGATGFQALISGTIGYTVILNKK